MLIRALLWLILGQNVFPYEISTKKATNSLSIGDFYVHENVYYIKGSQYACPLSSPFVFRKNHRDYLNNQFGTFKLNVEYVPNCYYQWREIGPKYGKLFEETEKTQGRYALVGKNSELNRSEIILSDNPYVSYVCGYETDPPGSFCESYDEICGKSCHCSDLIPVDHFCQILNCVNQSYLTDLDEKCWNCNTKLQSYGSPKITMTVFFPGTILIDIAGILKFVQLKNADNSTVPFSCYTDAVSSFPEVYHKYEFTLISGSDFIYGPNDDEDLARFSNGDDDAGNFSFLFHSKIGVFGHYWCEGFNVENSQNITTSTIIAGMEVSNVSSITLNITVPTKMFQKFTTPLTIHSNLHDIIVERIRNISKIDFRVEFLKIYNTRYNSSNEFLSKLAYRIYGPLDNPNFTEIEIMKEIDRIFKDSFKVFKNPTDKYESNTISLSASKCLEETLSVDGIELIWPETEIGCTVISNYLCLNSEGDILTRTCYGEFLYGVYWSQIDYCYPLEPSDLTNKLMNFTERIDNSSLVSLLNILNSNTEEINAIDIHFIVKILENFLKYRAPDGSPNPLKFLLMSIFDKLISLAETNPESFEKSQRMLNSTDRLLYLLERSIADIGIPNTNLNNVKIASTNIAIPNTEGIAFYCVTGQKILRNVTNLSEIDQNELELAVYIPEIKIKPMIYTNFDVAQSEIANYRVDFTLVAFKTYNFFTQKTDYAGTGWSFGMFFVKPEGVLIDFPTVQFLIKPSKKYRASTKMSCNRWNYGLNEVMFNTKGEWKSYIEGENFGEELILCENSGDHDGYFGLLLNGEEYTVFIDILAYIGSILSIIGAVAVIFTALVYRDWRDRAGTKILANFALVSFLHNLSDIISGTINIFNYREICISIGASMHYFMLTQFIWSLIFGYLQYQRYVKVFSLDTKHLVLKLALVAWGLPLIPVGLVLIIDKENYVKMKYCTLSGELIFWGLYGPFFVISMINLCVFIAIIRNLPKDQNWKYGFFLNLRLGFLLFFMFGFYYVFSLLAWITNVEALAYVFSMFASIQGFVIFFYYLFCNVNIRNFWWKCLKRSFFVFNCDEDDRQTSLHIHTGATINFM